MDDGKVISLEQRRKRKQREESDVTVTCYPDADPGEIGSLVDQTSDGDEPLVVLHTSWTEPTDDGLGLTPVQARALALALMEMADDVEHAARGLAPPPTD